jgi:hypothetical protein
VSAALSELEAHFQATPFLSGACAGCCLGWHRWLWGLAAMRGDHESWTRIAATAARLLLPYYERAFRGDARLRAAIEAAEGLAGSESSELRATAEQLLSRVGRIQCGGGVAGEARDVVCWALRTALATRAAPHVESPPKHDVWSMHTRRDEREWLYCSFRTLTYTAHAMAKAFRLEQPHHTPKWRYANDTGKLRVQAAIREALG